jgi:hypothetical protein
MKPKRSQLLVILAAVVVLIIILTFFKLSSVLTSASLEHSQLPEQPVQGPAIAAATTIDHDAPKQLTEGDLVTTTNTAVEVSSGQSSEPKTITQLAGHKHAETRKKSSEVLRILEHSRNHCDAELERTTKYDFVDRRGVDWAWCNDKLKRHKIQMGLSWGTLSEKDQKTWWASTFTEDTIATPHLITSRLLQGE